MYRISCKGEPSFTLPRTDSEPWLKANIRPPYRTLAIFYELRACGVHPDGTSALPRCDIEPVDLSEGGGRLDQFDLAAAQPHPLVDDRSVPPGLGGKHRL